MILRSSFAMAAGGVVTPSLKARDNRRDFVHNPRQIETFHGLTRNCTKSNAVEIRKVSGMQFRPFAHSPVRV
jgi:hypothetical protein